MIRAGVVAVLLMLACSALAQDPVAEPKGYRMDAYRAPVPATLQGASVVTPEAAYALWKDGAAFIDVLPRPPKPADLPEGTIWRDKPRLGIPGALWLPNVGYGAIAEETATYFRRGLVQATGGDVTAPVVFFCLDACWMSWNAARRALEWGYSDVYWFPEGTDGWAADGHALVDTTPMPAGADG